MTADILTAIRAGFATSLSRVGVISTALLLLSGCNNASETSERVTSSSQAIVGGNEAWLNSAVALRTSQCSLLPAQDPAICSGLLISPTTVLVARHCVSYPANAYCKSGIDPNQPGTFQVAVGCHDILNDCPSANWKPVANAPNGIVVHPTDDIAIVHLAQAVSATPTRLVSPSRLAEIAVGDSVALYGWGKTAQDGYMSPVLMSVVRSILSIPLRLPGIPFMPGVFAVANQTNPYIGTNNGDSGGPAVVFRDGEWFSLGVTQGGSYGSDRTDLGLIPYYFQWILNGSSDFPAQSWLPSAQIIAVANMLL